MGRILPSRGAGAARKKGSSERLAVARLWTALKGGMLPVRFRRRRGGTGRAIFGEDWPAADGQVSASSVLYWTH